MRNACKSLAPTALALALFASCAALARAQGRDARLVSARAGGVNYTAGDVTVRRSGQQSWQTLLRTDDLRSGDAVRTGPDGRAEILLNPGSYLRLGENTEMSMTDTSLNSLRFRVARGSAIVEAAILDGASPALAAANAPKSPGSVIEATARKAAGFVILIDTPRTQALVVRSGIYRVNVAPDGATEFVVRKGRALVGRDAVTIKDGDAASSAAGGAVEVSKFDKKRKDDLDVWGKRRAEEVAEINSHLKPRAVGTMLSSMSWNSFGWGSSPLSGLWYFDTRSMCYTYLPFFGWSSPYGFDYSLYSPWLGDMCGCSAPYFYRPRPLAGDYRGGGMMAGGTRGTVGGGVVTGGGSSGGSNNRGGGGATVIGGGMNGDSGGRISGGSGRTNGGEVMTNRPTEMHVERPTGPPMQRPEAPAMRRVDPPR